MTDNVALIPAYNEQASVGRIVALARQAGVDEIVVINDASTDATAAEAGAAGATVLSLPLQLGAWGATQTGMRYALRRGYQTAITLDADGQHDPAFIQQLLIPIVAAQADVTIGAYPNRMSRARKIARGFFRLLTGLRLDDVTSGFRAYNRAALRVLAAPQATLLDYQDLGVLLLLRGNGLRTVEVPVQMTPRHSGKSRVFSSWFVVAKYMMQTSLLCIARVGNIKPDMKPDKR